MNIIWKYSIGINRICSISKAGIMLPKNGRILKVGMQGDSVCFWVMFNHPEAQVEARYFYVIGTNQIVPEGANYLDTVFDGDYVWHIFEEKL